MKKIIKISLLAFSILLAHSSFALVASTGSKAVLTQKKETHRPKLTKRIGLWLLKRKIKKLQKKNRSLFRALDSTDCATIYLQTGDSLQVKLLRTTDRDVTYRRCDPNDNLLVSLSKMDIKRIVLSGGIEVYTAPKKQYRKKRKIYKQSDGSHHVKLGSLALITGLFSLLFINTAIGLAFLFGLASIILGIIALSKGDKNRAYLGIILGIISLLFSIIQSMS